MSLINDALKRARVEQGGGPTAHGPTLRPVDSYREPVSAVGWFLPTLLVIVLVLAGLAFWLWYRSTSVTKVRANYYPSSPAASARVQPVPSVAATPPPAMATAIPSAVPAAAATNAPAQVAANPAPTPTNQAASAEPPKPAAQTYKLQGIFYRPERPLAVINGKMVAIGDRVGDAHVLSIEPESASLLLANGQTNILEMP